MTFLTSQYCTAVSIDTRIVIASFLGQLFGGIPVGLEQVWSPRLPFAIPAKAAPTTNALRVNSGFPLIKNPIPLVYISYNDQISTALSHKYLICLISPRNY